MGPQGPQGVPGEGMFWKYYTYTVKSQDWQLVTSPDGLNTYYMYEFQNKDITDDLYIDGYVGKRSFLCAIQRFYRATARRYGISFSP